MECIQDQPGYARAVALYGQPAERVYRYAVSADTYDHWLRVLSKRSAEVVLVVSRTVGWYLVHTKAFYPPGTYRLLTGGLQPGEDLLAGLQRELYEETGLVGQVTRFLATQTHHFRRDDITLRFHSYLFAVDVNGGRPVAFDPGEQITAFREVDREGLRVLAERLENMEPAWAEWGRFRATSHWLAWELLGREDARHG